MLAHRATAAIRARPARRGSLEPRLQDRRGLVPSSTLGAPATGGARGANCSRAVTALPQVLAARSRKPRHREPRHLLTGSVRSLPRRARSGAGGPTDAPACSGKPRLSRGRRGVTATHQSSARREPSDVVAQCLELVRDSLGAQVDSRMQQSYACTRFTCARSSSGQEPQQSCRERRVLANQPVRCVKPFGLTHRKPVTKSRHHGRSVAGPVAVRV